LTRLKMKSENLTGSVVVGVICQLVPVQKRGFSFEIKDCKKISAGIYLISESTLTSEHYFLSVTQRSGEKTVYGQVLVTS